MNMMIFIYTLVLQHKRTIQTEFIHETKHFILCLNPTFIWNIKSEKLQEEGKYVIADKGPA